MSKSVLLVGTKSSGITYLAMLLEQVNYETHKCHDLAQLDRLLVARQFDLVIVDDHKPALNAIEVHAHLCENPRNADMPIVLLLGDDDKGAKALPGNVCKQNVLQKPILPHLLIKKVADAIPNLEISG